MIVSQVPLVWAGDRDPLVVRVRQVLNLPGGDVLDEPMVQVIRGIQRARGREPHGLIDEVLLADLDMVAY